MRIVRDLRGLVAVAWKDFHAVFTSRRFLVVSAIVVVLLILIATGLGYATLGSRGIAEPLTLWHREAAGAVAAFAFAFIPLITPFMPINVAYDARRKDLSSGFLETAVARPVPRWTLALGKFLGMFLATAIPVLLGTLAGIAVIEALVFAPVPAPLIGGVLVGALLLLALYVSLVLVFSLVLSPGATRWLALLLWVAFNLVRSSAFFVGGQYLLIVQIQGPQTFESAWGDWISFTGMYQGLLAPIVPDSLSFVLRPDITNLGGSLAYQSVPAAGLIWLLALLILYVALLGRYPLGR